MKTLTILAALAACFLTPTTSALADPRLDEKVYTPYIENGMSEFEVRNAGLTGGADGGADTTVLELEQGLNDRMSLAVFGVIERAPKESARLTSIGLESVIYLGQIPGVGIDTGAYLEYRQGLAGEPSAFEGKLLMTKTVDRFRGTVNLIVERPLSGPEAYGAYGYAASATWRTAGQLRLGAEAFGDLGDDHLFGGRRGAWAGPQLLWEGRPTGSPVELEVDAGWLFPVGVEQNLARSSFRLGLELERRF